MPTIVSACLKEGVGQVNLRRASRNGTCQSQGDRYEVVPFSPGPSLLHVDWLTVCAPTLYSAADLRDFVNKLVEECMHICIPR
jgi:hypothetical protein